MYYTVLIGFVTYYFIYLHIHLFYQIFACIFTCKIMKTIKLIDIYVREESNVLHAINIWMGDLIKNAKIYHHPVLSNLIILYFVV